MNAESTISTLQEQLAQALRLIEELSAENRWLKQQIVCKDRQIFGPRSEALDAGQLSLYESGLVGVADPEPLKKAEGSAKPRRAKPGHGRSPFDDSLERHVVDCDLPESERTCSCCASPLQFIGEDVTERGDYIPASLKVIQYRKKKYACPNGHEVRTGSAPEPLIGRCKYEPSVFAEVAVEKYGDHVPLNRQQEIWKRRGVDLPRSTMWDMLVRVDEIAAQPILVECRRQLLEEAVLQADETTVPVVTKGQKGSKTGYFWAWRAGVKTLIRFTTGRGRDGPKRMLGAWRGTLVVDGYSGYDAVAKQNSIVRAGCWAHARRKFKEDLDTGSTEPREILRLINRLFWLERACRQRAKQRGLDEEQGQELRRDVRQRRSRKILEQIDREARRLRQLRICTPKSKLGKALTYLENQRLALAVFLDDPAVPIDNNACERALRHIVLGRKNWQLAGSVKGAQVAANLYSLVATCRAMDIDPQKYLADVLVAVSNTPSSQIARLTPWAWIEEHPEARLS